MSFDSTGDLEVQVTKIAEVLMKKAGEERQEEEIVSQARDHGKDNTEIQ
jgi:hypothetical protein